MLNVEPPTAAQGAPKGAPGPDAVIYLKVPPYLGVFAEVAVDGVVAAGLGAADVVAAGAGADGDAAAGAGLAAVAVGAGVCAGAAQPKITVLISRATRMSNNFFTYSSFVRKTNSQLIKLNMNIILKYLSSSPVPEIRMLIPTEPEKIIFYNNIITLDE
jgi:hypothetical protein